MATITLTEMNRNPSRVSRLARVEPVTITERGEPILEVRAIRPTASRIDALIRAGLAIPATNVGTSPFRAPALAPDVAQEIVDDFWQERERREW